MKDTNPLMIDLARNRVSSQVASLELLKHSLDDSFVEAVQHLAIATKVVTTGLGKSGVIARKMTATLASLQVPSLYIHPVDALHGDSGVLVQTDCVVAFSKSGETDELLRFIDFVQAINITVVSVTSRKQSALASKARHSILAPIAQELDKDNVVPTASTTNALVMADLLSLATSEARGGSVDQFKQRHPGGLLGSALHRTVAHVMHSQSRLPIVGLGASLLQALTELTAKGLGAVCIVGSDGTLAGLITDGDVRRIVQSGKDVTSLTVEDVLTPNPISISPNATLHDALSLMEQRVNQLSALPVVDNGVCIGLIRVHDIVRANLA